MRLEVLSDTALRQLEPARLMALITHVQRFIDKAVAYQRRLIAVAESQRAARAVGDACVADTLVRNTGMSRGAARRASRQAKIIAAQPAVAGALACGDINTDQAEAIARADVADETRRELVAAAASEGTDATRERAAAAEIAARNETPEQRFMRQHANRFLRFYNNRDGMVCLEGALDPDSGARLKAKVSAIANRMWRTDKQQPPSHRRSPEQRDIDALSAATSRSTRPDPGRTHSHTDGRHQRRRDMSGPRDGDQPQSPQAGSGEAESVVGTGAAERSTASKATTAGTTTAEAGDSATGDRCCDEGEWADFDDDGKRVLPVLRVSTSLDALRDGLHRAGITDSGENLSAATLRRMACDAEIIPTVLNSKGRVIDVGRRTRRVSEALRCVLIARDGGCVWPGCDVPPSRCDAHHIKHWANGGLTNADNLALLCHRHHILLHEGRHRLKRVDDAWVVLKPDGTCLHTPLAASGGDNGSGHLRADDPITSCWPDSGAFSDLAMAASTETTAATAPRPSRTPSAGLATAAYTDRSAATSDVDPTMRSTNGAAPTPSRHLTLACGGRNELTVRLTAAGPRDDEVQAGPTVGYGDSRCASHGRTAPPAIRGSTSVSPANEGPEPSFARCSAPRASPTTLRAPDLPQGDSLRGQHDLSGAWRAGSPSGSPERLTAGRRPAIGGATGRGQPPTYLRDVGPRAKRPEIVLRRLAA